MRCYSNGSLESLIKPDIRTLSKKLSHLISFIGNGDCRIPQELWRRSISAAYEVELHVDSILVRCNALQHLLFTLPSALKEIELTNKEFVEVSGSSLSMGSSRVAKPSPLISTRSGSKIILTSRVAWQAKKLSDPYYLQFLTTEESWELLQKKVFQGDSCPPELCEVGLQAARKCKGLPLVIVLIAGIIAKASLWNEIARHLSSHLVWDKEKSM
ncbi:hypothetical protein RND71_039657 [Anisodus tanguticus]|uniref:NB-ARC domain-containing protein n=1 Tax=Anisodus tanguticus TaxID=243964 RepID=A0AAE1UVJ3_9SOLA|nr:hypothetical protein RND71_039657 [Anisodus tanguticus]